MCQGPQITQVQQQIKQILGEYLEQDGRFTGKIVFTVNCHLGGVGNMEAFVQKKIEGIQEKP